MLEMAGEIADGVLISVGAAPGAGLGLETRSLPANNETGRQPHTVRRILVVQAMVDENKARAIDHMRPCVAGNYRHGPRTGLLLSLACLSRQR